MSLLLLPAATSAVDSAPLVAVARYLLTRSHRYALFLSHAHTIIMRHDAACVYIHIYLYEMDDLLLEQKQYITTKRMPTHCQWGFDVSASVCIYEQICVYAVVIVFGWRKLIQRQVYTVACFSIRLNGTWYLK